MKENLFVRNLHFILILTLSFTVLVMAMGNIRTPESPDLLLFSTDFYLSPKSSLRMYDPTTGMTALLLSNIDFWSYSLSTNNRLAYSLIEGEQRDIFIRDIHVPEREALNITQTPETDEDVLSWSPDGRYLAFAVTGEDNYRRLYVWDGKTAVDITPDDMTDVPEAYYPEWSSNGRLAFTVNFGLYDTDAPGEIYLWDGHRTINLSQNPDGGDGGLAWSNDGQIAFSSNWQGANHIFVWDGISIKNGVPDKDAFMDVAPGMIGYYSFPAWTPHGQVVFISQAAKDTHAQIYLWDGQTATDISQNPNLHNGTPVWSHDGRWAFVTFFSAVRLYVRDQQGNALLTTEGQYTPAWSSNGYLIFCRYDRPKWILSMWDGHAIGEIVRSRDISTRWQSGSSIACTSG